MDIKLETLHQKFEKLFIHENRKHLLSGFQALDEMDVFKLGNLNVVAGRPGMMTRALIFNLILEFAVKNNFPVLYLNPQENKKAIVSDFLELLSDNEKFLRPPACLGIFSELFNINTKSVSANELYEIDKFFDFVNTLSLSMEFDRDYVNLDNIMKKLKNNNLRLYPRVLILDNFQEILSRRIREKYPSRPNKARRKELRLLKRFAQRENILIILKNSIKTEVEWREGHYKRPQLNDLVNLKEAEFHCDNILLLFRPEYYLLNHMGYQPLIYEGHALSSKNVLEINTFQRHTNWKTYLEIDIRGQKLSEFRQY